MKEMPLYPNSDNCAQKIYFFQSWYSKYRLFSDRLPNFSNFCPILGIRSASPNLMSESALANPFVPIGVGVHFFHLTLFCSKIGLRDQDFQAKLNL